VQFRRVMTPVATALFHSFMKAAPSSFSLRKPPSSPLSDPESFAKVFTSLWMPVPHRGMASALTDKATGR